MNQPVVNYDHKTIQMRRGGTSEWRRYGTICTPAEGEICVEFFQDASGTRNGNVGIKVGNGIDVFSALPYLITNQNEDDRISDEQIQNWDLTVEKLANLTAAEIAQDNSALGDDVQAALNDLHSRLLAIDPDGGSIEIDDIPGLGDKLDTKAEQADLEQEILDRIAGDKALQDQIDAIDPDGDSDVDWSDIENKPTEFPPEAHDQGWDTITGKPTDYPPSPHGHEIADVNGLQDALDAAGGTPAWDDVTGKPSTYPPEDHSHEQSEVDGLELRLEAIEGSITDGGGFVDAPDDGKLYGRQSEAWAEVVIPDAGASSWNDLTDKPTEFPPASHNHDGVYQPVGDYIGDAPNDGEEYARKSQGWVKLQDHNYTGADAVKLTGDQSVAGHKTWTDVATFGDTVTMRGTLNGDDTANFQNAVTAGSFVKTGGTSSEYLMADGSVSSGPDGAGIEDGDTAGEITTWTGTEWAPNAGVIVDVAGNGDVSLVNSDVGVSRGLRFDSAGAERGSITYHAGIGEMKFISGYDGYGGLMTFNTNGGDRLTIDAEGNARFSGKVVIGGDSTTGGAISTRCNGGSATWSDGVTRTRLARFENDESESIRTTMTMWSDNDKGVVLQGATNSGSLSLATRTGSVDNINMTIDGKTGDAEFNANVIAENVIAEGVSTNSVHSSVSGRGGFVFASSSDILPANHLGADTDAVFSLGRRDDRFKDGHFSGTLHSSGLKTSGDITPEDDASSHLGTESNRWLDVWSWGYMRGSAFQTHVDGNPIVTFYGRTIYSEASTGVGFHFGANTGTILPCKGTDGATTDGAVTLGNNQKRFNHLFIKGSVLNGGGFYQNDGEAVLSVNVLLDAFKSLRTATADETSVESLRDSIGNCLGGLIEKLETIQSKATADIERMVEEASGEDEPLPQNAERPVNLNN